MQPQPRSMKMLKSISSRVWFFPSVIMLFLIRIAKYREKFTIIIDVRFPIKIIIPLDEYAGTGSASSVPNSNITWIAGRVKNPYKRIDSTIPIITKVLRVLFVTDEYEKEISITARRAKNHNIHTSSRPNIYYCQ